MDSSERQRLLFVKATANAQRRMREVLLRHLPDAASATLAQAPFLVFPETDEVLRRYYPATADGIGMPTRRPRRYLYREFGKPEKALAAAASGSIADMGADSLLGLSISSTWFKDEQWLAPSLPLFVVDASFVARHFELLWEISRGAFSLVAKDFKRGLVMDTYLGYVPDDPDPREIVYEIASWDDHD